MNATLAERLKSDFPSFLWAQFRQDLCGSTGDLLTASIAPPWAPA